MSFQLTAPLLDTGPTPQPGMLELTLQASDGSTSRPARCIGRQPNGHRHAWSTSTAIHDDVYDDSNDVTIEVTVTTNAVYYFDAVVAVNAHITDIDPAPTTTTAAPTTTTATSTTAPPSPAPLITTPGTGAMILH